jgi:hypothetical protein
MQPSRPTSFNAKALEYMRNRLAEDAADNAGIVTLKEIFRKGYQGFDTLEDSEIISQYEFEYVADQSDWDAVLNNSKTWHNFSMTLHNLTLPQYAKIERRMMELQKELEKEFGTTGGDHIGTDSGDM